MIAAPASARRASARVLAVFMGISSRQGSRPWDTIRVASDLTADRPFVNGITFVNSIA
jgi:hypothetical protein